MFELNDSQVMKPIKIHEVLKRELKERQTNLMVISKATKLPYSTLNNWYHKAQSPKNIKLVKKLADHLELTLDELLFDEKREVPVKEKEIAEILLSENFELVLRKSDS